MEKKRQLFIENSPKYLWFLILTYTMVIAISNWFNVRLVEIFHVTLSPGTLIFPLTFLLSDIITEVYGYKHARRAIWAAFLFNLIFIGFGQIVIHLPSPSLAVNNAGFDKLLAMNAFVVIGSFVSYLTSEPINSLIVAKLKVACKGELMGLRFVLSTVVASAIDSVMFTTIAFGRTYPLHNLLMLMFSIWLVKVVIEILGLPLSIRLAKWLKKKEKLDVYDLNTNFNPVSLNSQYSVDDNLFNKDKG
jgi:uncharacterized integral membrane protein (TIGR00697 family)